MDNHVNEEQHPLHLVHVHYATRIHTHRGSENDRFYMAQTTTSTKNNVAKVKVRAKDSTSAKNKAATYMSQSGKRVTKVEHHGVISEKKFERIEPSFDPPKPKPVVKKQSLVQKIASRFKKQGPAERIEPSFDPPKPKEAQKPAGKIEPTLDGKPPAKTRIVRGEKGRFKKEVIPPAPPVENDTVSGHKFVINKDNSVHYHAPDGSKHQMFGPMTNKSSAHQLTLDAVRFIHNEDPNSKIHVHDSSGGYGKFVNMKSKSSEKWAETYRKKEASRQSRLNDPNKKVRDKAEQEHVPSYSMSPIPNHKITEEKMFTINENKYAPKKLRDITLKPSRKWNEYDGNTKDEQEIVDRFRKNAVQHPDRNGNGDDIFKAVNLKRVEKPMVPGEDEKKYAEWNGDVKNIEEKYSLLSFSELLEATRPLVSNHYGEGTTEKIRPHHLDYHWATKYVAQPGDRISQHGDDAVIHHYSDGGHHTTRIENGAKHISEMPKGTYDKPAGRTDAHAGKHIVMRTTMSYKSEPRVDFVGAKKNKSIAGGHIHVDNEEHAKEFKTAAHAHNHANMMNRYHDEYGDGGHPKHYTVHPKRDAQQIKKANLAHAAAKKEHEATLKKHGGNIFHPEVEKSYHKMVAAKSR